MSFKAPKSDQDVLFRLSRHQCLPKVITARQQMYSGVPLMSFILAEYIMTHKDRSALGTGDWAIFRLEFILQNIPAPTTRKEQSCEKARVLPAVIYHQTHTSTATMAKGQTSAELNLSFQSVGLFRGLVLGWRFTGQIKWCALVLMRGRTQQKQHDADTRRR